MIFIYQVKNQAKRNIVLLACAVAFLMPFTTAHAVDGMHLARVALAGKQQNALPPLPWIDNIRLDSQYTTSSLHLADGRRLMQIPGVVRSVDGVGHNQAKFYKPERARMSVVMHYAGRQPAK